MHVLSRKISNPRTVRSTKRSTNDINKLPQNENCANEDNKKKNIPKLSVKTYGDNSSFFDSVYHEIKKDKEKKIKQKRKTQRDRVKALKNVEVSTPKNRLKRKCDLNFDISPITFKNATIDLASFECDEEPVNKSPKLSNDHKSPEIVEQVPLEVDLLKELDSKVTKSQRNSSIKMAGITPDTPVKPQSEVIEESGENKMLEVTEKQDETSFKPPQSPENSLSIQKPSADEQTGSKIFKKSLEVLLSPDCSIGVPEPSMNEVNKTKISEKSLTVPEIESNSLNDPELSIPPSKVSKIDKTIDQSSFDVLEVNESATDVPDKDKSKQRVVQFIDVPEKNKVSELRVSKINEGINLRPGKWRRSLAAWRKSHNPTKIINRTSRRFVALFPIRTDPGVLEKYKKKLHESLEKCKYQ